MKRKQYSKDFKIGAINQVLQEDKNVSRVAKELGINPTMLSRWIYEYKNNEEAAFTGNGNKIINEEFQVDIMKKKLKEVELENEILKKFQAFLQISRQGYYQYIKRGKSTRTLENEVLLDKINYAYYDNKSLYGSLYDNALMESFYKSLKTELLLDGKFETIEKAKNAVFEYIEMFYNTKRLHS